MAFFKNHALAERAFSQPPCQRPLDMGCGFSTEDTKASDEERILKASDGVTGKAETTAQTRMGGTLAKKSPAKKRRGDSKCKEQGDFLTFLTFFFLFFVFFCSSW